MKNYNITQLHPEIAFERHIFHRDMFAHYLRWTHVLRLAKIGMNILDFGCGSGNLYEVLYRNRYKPNKFLGLDIRKFVIEKNRDKFPKAEWQVEDLVNIQSGKYGNDWDIITSFEVAEHVGKSNVDKFLWNIENLCNKNTIILISTPCYNEKVGAAKNHTYDCGDGKGIISQELTYLEMKDSLEKHFIIEEHFGTFASQSDYKDHLSDNQLNVFNKLHGYYDSNLISIIFAPLFPQYSRNVLWKCKLK